MPLVVPGLMSSSKDKNDDWATKLMGKKLGDSNDNTVRLSLSIPPSSLHTIPHHSAFIVRHSTNNHRHLQREISRKHTASLRVAI